MGRDRGKKERRRVKGARARQVTVTVDRLTDACVKVVAQTEGCSYSAALCAMVISVANTDKRLKAVMKREIEKVVKARVESEGWAPGLNERIAKELLGAPPEIFRWN